MTCRLPARVCSSPSCFDAATRLRSFTTSASRHDGQQVQRASNLSPESPRFVHVPQPRQPSLPPKVRIRGVLPVPRNILNRRNADGVARYAPENLYQSITQSIRKPQSNPADAEPKASRDAITTARLEWKQRQSLHRRQNLLQGLEELQLRESKRRRIERQRKESRNAYYAREDAEAAQRRAQEDLTNPTCTTVMTVGQKGMVPDPDREERLAEMRARVIEIEKRRVADRKDALHTLYMHAQDFIVNEEQLNAAIDRSFGTDAWARRWGNNDISIWHQREPEGVTQLLAKATKQRKTLDDTQGFASTAKRRIQRIAEELTGGKI